MCNAEIPDGFTFCPACASEIVDDEDIGATPLEIVTMLKTVYNVMDLCGYDKKTKSDIKTVLLQAQRLKGGEYA